MTQSLRTVSPRVAALALAAGLALLPSIAHAEPGDELEVSVLTMGPGDHPFFKFGHNALRIVEKGRRKLDMVYNWGTFDFTPQLIPTFIKGRMKYWLSTTSMAGTVYLYKAENRTLDEQVLDLTAAEKLELKALVDENLKGDNRYYKYDYYRDNCSTRVRDVIDRVTQGRLRAAATEPAEYSWRGHTRRLVADDRGFYLALHVVLAGLVDKPIDQWEEMFLPAKVQAGLRRATVVRDGQEVPLVKVERRLLEAPGRAPDRAAPPVREPYMGLAGAALGLGFFQLGKRAKQSAAARVGLGLGLALVGLLFGFLGTFFTVVWLATDHAVSHRNENILTCAPWVLGLVGFGIGVARNRFASTSRARDVVFAAAAAASLGLVLKVLPWFRQDNWEFLALTIPMWGGAALGLRAHLGSFGAPATKAGPPSRKSADSVPASASSASPDSVRPSDKEPS